MRIAVAGGEGFLGGALLRRLENARAIPRAAWSDPTALSQALRGCDAVVCAAGKSRMDDAAELYRINMALAHTLVAALEQLSWRGRLVFLSTTHEARDTPYHASKRDSRALFDAWAERSGGTHIGVLLPNTFGPGGRPFFNSALHTFAWQISRGESPAIHDPGAVMALCQIDTAVSALIELLRAENPPNPAVIADEFSVTVGETVERLRRLHAEGKPADALDRALAGYFHQRRP